MRTRVDAGTDVAMIGAWDAQQNASPFTSAEFADHQNSLDRDVSQGALVLIRTGGDGGGPVDLYIDEPAPPEVLARVTPVAGEARLSLPTGALTVGGVEDYRSADARITGPGSLVTGTCRRLRGALLVATDPEQEPASRDAAAAGLARGHHVLRRREPAWLPGRRAHAPALPRALVTRSDGKSRCRSRSWPSWHSFRSCNGDCKRNPRYQRLDANHSHPSDPARRSDVRVRAAPP